MAKNNKTVAVLLTVCLVAVCAAVFAACETYEPCTVTFVVDGKVVDTVNTSDDGTAVFPADPQPTVGYAFDGWYDDDGNVFYLCPSLTEVYFGGQSAAWDAVTVGSSNDGLDSATVYCYSESAPAESGNFWHYVDGVVTRW